MKCKHIDEEFFKVQLIAYRSYNSGVNGILQVGPLTYKAEEFSKFLEPITANGGWGREATEAGLWFVNKNFSENLPYS